MTRVEWSRLSGNEVEAVLGVLLCREHPTATRVKASRGDGGIDVWVPEGDAATVYQIKGYTGNIDSTRQRHIESSWQTLLAYAKANSITLSAWYLVTPENPTKEQLSWFQKLTKGAAFPCVWRGLDFVDGLAAKYPEVIDYYLRDGKDRLETTVQRLLSVAGLNNPAASPASSVESLRELHKALNQFDPHFYYDFSVQTVNSDGICPPAPIAPRAIAAVRLSSNEQCITYNINPRFNEALKERPVPGSMTFTAEPGSALHEQIEDWAKFGTPLTDVPAKDIRWDLPGGFGGPPEEGRVTIGASKPDPGSANEAITLRVLDPNDAVAASLDFITEEVSAGIGLKGVRNVGHDKEAGLIRYELRMSRESCTGPIAAKINISVEDPVGRLPGDMLPGLRFVAALRPPRRIQIFSRNGPALAPPLPVPQELIPEGQGQLWLLMCESLATIQRHVIERISFPDMARYHAGNPMDDIEWWYQAARLLCGEVVSGTWGAVGIHMNPGEQPPAVVPQGILFNNYYSVRVGAKTFQLGILTMQPATVRVDPAHPPVVHDDHMDVQFIPGDDDTMAIRMASPASTIGTPDPGSDQGGS